MPVALLQKPNEADNKMPGAKIALSLNKTLALIPQCGYKECEFEKRILLYNWRAWHEAQRKRAS